MVPPQPEQPPRGFVRGVRSAQLRPGLPDVRPVTEPDLEQLPEQVRRYLRFMGVVGRTRDRSLRAHLTGRFRRGPDAPWARCDAWQYSTAGEPARLFRMRLAVGGLPTIAWDTYLRGRGRMRAAIL